MAHQEHSIPAAKIHLDHGAEARVQQLGLPGVAALADALHDGASGARATTAIHPRAYRGQRMWGETVASLRQGLEANGWEGENFHGVDLVVDRRLGTALVVTAGDSATGRAGYVPQVRYERKEVIQKLVNGGYDTLWDAEVRPEWEVWFLLHHLDADGLQAELSLPTEIAASGRVRGWVERILLPDTAFGGPGSTGRRVDEGPPAIDVEVQRRAG